MSAASSFITRRLFLRSIQQLSLPSKTLLPTCQTALRATPSSSVVRFYGATSPQLQALRRRRKRKEDTSTSSEEIEGNPLKHEPITDLIHFTQSADALISKLEKALESMKAKNEVFVLSRLQSEAGPTFTIDLSPKEGSYRLEFYVEDCILQYASPVSGEMLYVLSAKTGEWVGSEDGHSFEGILVRDLIRQCQGMPDL